MSIQPPTDETTADPQPQAEQPLAMALLAQLCEEAKGASQKEQGDEHALAAARALLFMDAKAFEEATREGNLDLLKPLCSGMHAMELWEIGCRALPREASMAARATLMALFEHGADIRKIRDSGISKDTTAYFEPLAGEASLRALCAQSPSEFFDTFDHVAAMDALAEAMKTWGSRFGIGRETWVEATRSKFGDRGCHFGQRPSPALAIIMFQAFGKSFEPEQWLFMASSSWNSSLSYPLLTQALGQERPSMGLDARERFASAALANDLPDLLAAIAGLPGGLGMTLKGRNIEYFNHDKILDPDQDVPLPWALLSRERYEEAPSPSSPIFLALQSIDEHLKLAMEHPALEAFARMRGCDLIAAHHHAPWIFQASKKREHWGLLLRKRDLPEIITELCQQAPELALEALSLGSLSLEAAMARRGELVEWARSQARWPSWEQSSLDEGAEKLNQAFSSLESWGLAMQTAGVDKLPGDSGSLRI